MDDDIDVINARIDPARAPAIDPETARVYRSMPRAALERLAVALALDRDSPGAAPHTRQFCETRLAYVRQLLA